MVHTALSNLFPRQITNVFPGSKVALWGFYLFTALTLWRSQHHIFSSDGGAQSIATIPLENIRFCRFNHNWDVCVMGLISVNHRNNLSCCRYSLSVNDSNTIFTQSF